MLLSLFCFMEMKHEKRIVFENNSAWGSDLGSDSY